jgi:hypothetical protein
MKHISNTLTFITHFWTLIQHIQWLRQGERKDSMKLSFPPKLIVFWVSPTLNAKWFAGLKKNLALCMTKLRVLGAVFSLRPLCEPVRAETLHGSQLVLRCLWWLGDQWRYVGAWIRRLLRTVAIPGFRNSGITSSAHEASPLLTSSSRRKES